MPGILISFILLLVAIVVGWRYRRGGIVLFYIVLMVSTVVLWHHTTSQLNIYL